jgi:TolB protein
MLAAVVAFTLGQTSSVPRADDPQEKHLRNLRQLTFSGQNAEAYWSADGRYISYQASTPDKKYPDEQIFVMKADGSRKQLVSTGKGRCTCAYVSPDNRWIYFSSTHATQPEGQPPVDMSKGYVWAINPNYVMYKRRLIADKYTMRGAEDDKVLFTANLFQLQGPTLSVVRKPGSYVAETTIAPNGKYMVWTSDVSGDLEIYRSDLNGKNQQRLTDKVGYDGGPFISWDSKKIVYRRDSFADAAAEKDYVDLLKEHMIRPSKLEIWVMDADGRNKRQVTRLGCASFAPFMHPDGKRIIFSSNYGDPKKREFDIFMINVDGTHLERITRTKEFDGFPMFTRDGKRLVFASNRYGAQPHDTNIFVADWRN